jgi:hypothetical protein
VLRNPSYLDIDLLQNIADSLGIDYPVETKVRVLGGKGRIGSLGVSIPGITLGGKGEMTSSNETETTYEVPVRPVKVLSDVLDKALVDGDVRDFTVDPGEILVSRRDVVQIEGVAELSSLSEAAGFLEQALPMLSASMPPQTEGGPPPELIMAMLAGTGVIRPLLYELDAPTVPVRVLIHLDPTWFYRNASADDVSGDVTVFGIVDQLLADGSTLDATRYLMPGANRAARRAFGPEQMQGLLASMGRPGADSMGDGPLWIVKPIAIF